MILTLIGPRAAQKPGEMASQPAVHVPSKKRDSINQDDNVPVQDSGGIFQPITSNGTRPSPQDVLPVLSPSTLHQHARPFVETRTLPSMDSTDHTLENIDTGDFSLPQADENALLNQFDSQSLDLDDLDLFLAETAMDGVLQGNQSPQLTDFLLPTFVAAATPSASIDWQLYNTEALIPSAESGPGDSIDENAWRMSEFDPSVDRPTSSILALFNPSSSKDLFPLYDQPRALAATPETIKHLFELQTCSILSIKDDQTRNPWRTLIWPLAYNCPPLYSALAAMTCLHLCRAHPELHVQGTRHFQRSVQTLAAGEEKDQIPLESALATRLALGFAESWDHQKSSTGIDYINSAKKLIEQAVRKHQASQLNGGELSRLSFLVNTWIYMDVIARFTSPNDERSTDFEFMTACSLLSPIPREQQFDPLMGCAITLFPMIGRLADLVGRVRRRAEKHNSPAIISKAVDLRIEMERWVPPMDENAEAPNSNASDSIQTAEAYRWAALLLLRQTVPELPWSQSMWELAEKALIFLATVPLTSRKTIVQIFPLMVAGTEATETEDRDWVLERWGLMSKHMITGIVDRCKKVTTEVWRRRDEYLATGTVQDGHDVKTPPDPDCRSVPEAQAQVQPRSPSSEFPESLAFKKGIDLLTRAGSIKYTVKGDLHWLGVMKEWGWEGESWSCSTHADLLMLDLFQLCLDELGLRAGCFCSFPGIALPCGDLQRTRTTHPRSYSSSRAPARDTPLLYTPLPCRFCLPIRSVDRAVAQTSSHKPSGGSLLAS